MNMLLPSALSCDSGLYNPRPQRPQRPKLPSFDRYDPRQRSQSPVVGLIASCRALHSMLGERFSPAPSPSLESTIRARPMGSSPFGEPTPPPVYLPAPRGKNKRTRDEWDDDDSDECMDTDTPSMSSHSDGFSTPKRQRRVPLELPQGLLAADFEALSAPTTERPVTIRRRTSAEDIDMPYSSPPPLPARLMPIPEDKSVSTWTENDDRVLVEAVLSKLKLSARDWNDCAVQLGKDKDSLGRRWRLLLGEGNIGLRRGSGRMERVDLDIKSW